MVSIYGVIGVRNLSARKESRKSSQNRVRPPLAESQLAKMVLGDALESPGDFTTYPGDFGGNAHRGTR